MEENNMPRLDGYMSGCNLGHWISQYGTQGREHWDTYIVESDFAQMAQWGVDHVRLPVDYFIFEDDDNPGVYNEAGLSYIDNTIAYAKKYGMNVVLDLHHAPGFFFGNGKKNDLFTNPESQERFVNIWKFFAARYINEKDNLRFELLNELVWENSDPWNELWQRTAAEIHGISPDRRVIVGGNQWNSVFQLKNLTVSDNPNIMYTFHMYEPFLFSHQRASWIENHRSYTKPVTYPFRFGDHAEYYNGNYLYGMTADDMADRHFLDVIFAPAIEFIKKNNRPLYLGEYGAISNSDNDSAVRWYNDVADICIENGIGRAVWSYRGFANITDAEHKPVDERMIKAITRK